MHENSTPQKKASPRPKPVQATPKLFKSIQDVKSFLLWAKAEGVLHLEIDGVTAQFHPAALANVGGPSMDEPQTDLRTPEQRKIDEQKEYDDLLFHSVT